jgi:hypothetical protein
MDKEWLITWASTASVLLNQKLGLDNDILFTTSLDDGISFAFLLWLANLSGEW